MGYELDLNPASIRIMYRRLMICGFTRAEATNLIARLLGLDVVKGGWKIDELVHIIFLSKIEGKLAH